MRKFTTYEIINELAKIKIKIDYNGNITEQLQEQGLDTRTKGDEKNLYNEVYDNLTTVFYLDECNQLWKRVDNDNFEYIAKIR